MSGAFCFKPSSFFAGGKIKLYGAEGISMRMRDEQKIGVLRVRICCVENGKEFVELAMSSRKRKGSMYFCVEFFLSVICAANCFVCYSVHNGFTKFINTPFTFNSTSDNIAIFVKNKK